MLNLMYTVNLPPGSDSKKLRQRTAQTASIVAEAAEAPTTIYSIIAGNTLTAKKAVVLNELSEEAQLFGGLNLDEVRMEQGLAITEKLDTDACGLFPGFSSSSDHNGQPLQPSHLIEADYKVGLANVPGPRIFVLHNIQTYQIKSFIVAANATVWGNPTVPNLLGDYANLQANGFVGTIFGEDVYETQHVPTVNVGVDRCGACLNPQYALAAATVRPPNT